MLRFGQIRTCLFFTVAVTCGCGGSQPLILEADGFNVESLVIDEQTLDIVYTTIVVTNQSVSPVVYTGFEENEPIFLNERRRWLVWTHFSAPPCGTGSTTYSLQPGESREMRVPLCYLTDLDQSRYRIGIDWVASREKPEHTIAWTRPFRVPSDVGSEG